MLNSKAVGASSIDVAKRSSNTWRKATNQSPSRSTIPTTPNKFTASPQIRHRMHRVLFHNRHRLCSLSLSRPSNICSTVKQRDKGRMAAQTNGTNGVPADASSENAPRKLNILMLHGTSSLYLQNLGPTLIYQNLILVLETNRIYTKRAPLPCQNQRDRKAHRKSLPCGFSKKPLLAPLKTIPRRNPALLPYRSHPAFTSRYPRLRYQRRAGRFRERQLGLVETRDWLRKVLWSRTRFGFNRCRYKRGRGYRWSDRVLAGCGGRGYGRLPPRSKPRTSF